MAAAPYSQGWVAGICAAYQVGRRSSGSRSSRTFEQEDLRLRFFDFIKEFSQPFIAKRNSITGAR
jgi:hypothetical protein